MTGSKRNSERGAALIEHALLICLIAIIAATAIPAVGHNAANKFDDAAFALDIAPGGMNDKPGG